MVGADGGKWRGSDHGRRGLALALAVSLAMTACNGGPGGDADPTTTVAAPTETTSPAPTTTTVVDYTTPPPWLVVDNWQGEQLEALSVYAWAEHAVVEAQSEPNNPHLPALAATHDPSVLAETQEVIRNIKDKHGEATQFNKIFTIRALEFAQPSPDQILITSCTTTDYMVYTIGSQPDPSQPVNSYRVKAVVKQIGGQWLLSGRVNQQIFTGKSSCTE